MEATSSSAGAGGSLRRRDTAETRTIESAGSCASRSAIGSAVSAASEPPREDLHGCRVFLRYAIDLIVMGTDGRTGVSRVLRWRIGITRASGGTCALVVRDPALQKILEISRFNLTFKMHRSLDDALRTE